MTDDRTPKYMSEKATSGIMRNPIHEGKSTGAVVDAHCQCHWVWRWAEGKRFIGKRSELQCVHFAFLGFSFAFAQLPAAILKLEKK